MIQKYSLYLAWMISCLATLGSLYFSEIRAFEPCSLCWYQRIALFPLPILLGIATYRNFTGIVAYVLPLVIVGLLFAFYHTLISYIPSWEPVKFCGMGPSCSEKISIGIEPITLPLLSLLTFCAIAFFLLLSLKKQVR